MFSSKHTEYSCVNAITFTGIWLGQFTLNFSDPSSSCWRTSLDKWWISTLIATVLLCVFVKHGLSAVDWPLFCVVRDRVYNQGHKSTFTVFISISQLSAAYLKTQPESQSFLYLWNSLSSSWALWDSCRLSSMAVCSSSLRIPEETMGWRITHLLNDYQYSV